MRKIFIFAMFAILLVGFVLAIAAPEKPICKVEGTIQSIEFKAAYNDTCISTDTCPTDTISRHPDEYFLNILIKKVSYVNGNATDATEGLRYIIGESKVFTILKTKVNIKLEIGQTIEFESNPYLNVFNSYKIINSDEEDEDEQLLGASCGTVTPGYQNECCVNKGYSGWDEEEWKCVGEEDNDEEGLLGAYAGEEHENEDNDEECEAWNCTKWSECINETKTRQCTKVDLNCTDDEEPRLTKSCYEKVELRHYGRTIDCPEECVCSGSTIKCTFENGTRVMTVYAGQSGNVIVQIKNLNMSTNVTLYKGENGRVYGTFRGNKTHEVMLPDEVKEKLQNHTRTRLYNESVNLTEDGYYQIEGKKKARLFWLVPVREHMNAEVNAETGETVKIRNPWWGFLARDVHIHEGDSEEESED